MPARFCSVLALVPLLGATTGAAPAPRTAGCKPAATAGGHMIC